MTYAEKWERIAVIDAALKSNRERFAALCKEKNELLMTETTGSPYRRNRSTSLYGTSKCGGWNQVKTMERKGDFHPRRPSFPPAFRPFLNFTNG